FYPFAYIIKLKIEISIANLISKVTKKRNYSIISKSAFSYTKKGYTRLLNKSFTSISKN
ncbi:uncharacterized protein BKA55DRAFT_530912, partial [Fusarium redolens]